MLVSTQAALDDIRADLSADVRKDLERLALHAGAALTRSKTPIDLGSLSKTIAGGMPSLTAAETDALALYAAFVLMSIADSDARKPAGASTREGGEMTASANTKLLQVQMSMQRENEIFTSVSNVLKTRHDTVKNSIANIR